MRYVKAVLARLVGCGPICRSGPGSSVSVGVPDCPGDFHSLVSLGVSSGFKTRLIARNPNIGQRILCAAVVETGCHNGL